MYESYEFQPRGGVWATYLSAKLRDNETRKKKAICFIELLGRMVREQREKGAVIDLPVLTPLSPGGRWRVIRGVRGKGQARRRCGWVLWRPLPVGRGDRRGV